MSGPAEAACGLCARTSFQLPSLCAEVGHYQCANFLGGGPWGALTECSSCCTLLLDPEQRGPFWVENCAGSPFALASWAPNAHGEADEELKLPAQAHSASAAYPWGEVNGGMAMKDYVFKKSYIDAPLMPFHTLRERFFDEQKEYGKQIMVGRARHMDGTLWREAVRLAEASGKDFDAKDHSDEWNRADAGATPLSADLERDGAAERSRGAKPGRDLERRAARPRLPSARARGLHALQSLQELDAQLRELQPPDARTSSYIP